MHHMNEETSQSVAETYVQLGHFRFLSFNGFFPDFFFSFFYSGSYWDAIDSVYLFVDAFFPSVSGRFERQNVANSVHKLELQPNKMHTTVEITIFGVRIFVQSSKSNNTNVQNSSDKHTHT